MINKNYHINFIKTNNIDKHDQLRFTYSPTSASASVTSRMVASFTTPLL